MVECIILKFPPGTEPGRKPWMFSLPEAPLVDDRIKGGEAIYIVTGRAWIVNADRYRLELYVRFA